MSAPKKSRVFRMVPVADVVIPDHRKRPLRDLDSLTASIRELGVIHPIVLTDDMHLVAGLHRLRACQAIGLTEIPAIVMSLSDLDAELAEIDENLCRTELVALERSEQTVRRKAIYEARHPETKFGTAQALGSLRAQGKGDVAADAAATFAKETSKRTGRSERAIREDAQIAEKIGLKVRDAIRESDLSDNKTELLALARIEDPAVQAKVAALLVDGKAKTVAAAQRQLGGGKGAATKPEPVRDEAGHVITDPALAGVFSFFRPVVEHTIREARARAREVVDAYEEKSHPSHRRIVSARDFPELRRAEQELKRAIDAFSLYVPWSVCPLCKVGKPDCLQCTGGGWVTKRSLELYLQTLRGGRLTKGALRGK